MKKRVFPGGSRQREVGQDGYNRIHRSRPSGRAGIDGMPLPGLINYRDKYPNNAGYFS